MKRFYAGGFFYNPDTRSVLLHKRDSSTPFNPNRWSFFGGTNEEDESPRQAWIREIQEELNVDISNENIIPLTDYLNLKHGTHRYVFYIHSTKEKSEMKLGEGSDFDWIPLNKVFELELSPSSEKDLRLFVSQI